MVSLYEPFVFVLLVFYTAESKGYVSLRNLELR